MLENKDKRTIIEKARDIASKIPPEQFEEVPINLLDIACESADRIYLRGKNNIKIKLHVYLNNQIAEIQKRLEPPVPTKLEQYVSIRELALLKKIRNRIYSL